MFVFFKVFPYASDQQTGYRIHGAGDVRLEYVPTKMLGLLPRGRLLQEAV